MTSMSLQVLSAACNERPRFKRNLNTDKAFRETLSIKRKSNAAM